jgi:hypothetical protein
VHQRHLILVTELGISFTKVVKSPPTKKVVYSKFSVQIFLPLQLWLPHAFLLAQNVSTVLCCAVL